MLANLLAVTTALGLPAKVACGFVDETVNQLLDVDPQREVAFSLVAVGQSSAAPPPSPVNVPALGLETVPLSRSEIDYPLMREMHAASSLHSKERGRHVAWPRSTHQFAAACRASCSAADII